MIHYCDAHDPARPGAGPKGPLFTQILPPDPLHGPARHHDPVAAMADDIAEIAASRGCVEQADLTQRGWTVAEIVEHLPDAIARAQGRGEPARVRAERVPA